MFKAIAIFLLLLATGCAPVKPFVHKPKQSEVYADSLASGAISQAEYEFLLRAMKSE